MYIHTMMHTSVFVVIPGTVWFQPVSNVELPRLPKEAAQHQLLPGAVEISSFLRLWLQEMQNKRMSLSKTSMHRQNKNADAHPLVLPTTIAAGTILL